ncbi:MAG: BrnT family toxin [Acidobacteria bacterium]|nr:BrnT family toxin [Acidobacteriota bacterium]
MRFESDRRKAAASLTKHGVDFADAAAVFHDEPAGTIRDDASGDERSVTLKGGMKDRRINVFFGEEDGGYTRDLAAARLRRDFGVFRRCGRVLT